MSLPGNDPSNSFFTQNEIIKYTKRKEEGYDLTTDLRYNFWLSLQPKSTTSDDVNSTSDVVTTRMLSQKTILTSILKKAPSVHNPDIQLIPKSSARVVTNEECRREINDKHLKKLEETKLREVQKLEREKKRMEKEQKKKEGMKFHLYVFKKSKHA